MILVRVDAYLVDDDNLHHCLGGADFSMDDRELSLDLGDLRLRYFERAEEIIVEKARINHAKLAAKLAPAPSAEKPAA